eukprot:gene1281-11367_t
MSKKSKEWIEKGLKEVENKNLDLALEYFTKAIEKSPNNEKAFTERSLIYLKQKNYKKALYDAEKAIEIKPNIIQGYFRKIEILFEMEKFCQIVNFVIHVEAHNIIKSDKFREYITNSLLKTYEMINAVDFIPLKDDSFLKKKPYNKLKYLNDFQDKITIEQCKTLGFNEDHLQNLIKMLWSEKYMGYSKLILKIVSSLKFTEDDFLYLIPLAARNLSEKFGTEYVEFDFLVDLLKKQPSEFLSLTKILSMLKIKSPYANHFYLIIKTFQSFSKEKKTMDPSLLDDLKSAISLLDKCFPETDSIYELFGAYEMVDCLPIIRKFLKENPWWKETYQNIMKSFGESIYSRDTLLEKCPCCGRIKFICQDEIEQKTMDLWDEKRNEMKEMYSLYEKEKYEEAYEKGLYLYHLCSEAFDEEKQDDKEVPEIEDFLGRCLIKLDRGIEAYYLYFREKISKETVDAFIDKIEKFDLIESNEKLPEPTFGIDFTQKLKKQTRPFYIKLEDINDESQFHDYETVTTINQNGVVFERNGHIELSTFLSKRNESEIIFKKKPINLHSIGDEVFIQFEDNSKILYNFIKKKQVYSEKTSCFEAYCVTFDDDYLIYAEFSNKETLKVYNRKTKEMKSLYGLTPNSLSIDGNKLFVLASHVITEIDLLTMKHVGTFYDFNDELQSSMEIFSVSKNYIVSVDVIFSKSLCRIWSRKTRQQIFTISNEDQEDTAFCVDTCDSYIALGFRGGIILILDSSSGKIVHKMKICEKKVRDLSIYEDESNFYLNAITSTSYCQKFTFPKSSKLKSVVIPILIKCSKCSKILDKREKRVCGRCLKQIYCSVECQTNDWKIHKKECEK